MAKGGNTGAIVILSILALGGLGLSGYMFIADQFLGGNEYLPEHEHESFTLVGTWDQLNGDASGSSTDFNFTFLEIGVNRSEYFSLNSANDTFTLLQEGWYKLTVMVTLVSLTSGNTYRCLGYTNGVFTHGFFDVVNPTSTLSLNLDFYHYSDGNDTIYIGAFTAVGSDAFDITGNDIYNNAYLEYLPL